jgi:ribonuclease PH
LGRRCFILAAAVALTVLVLRVAVIHITATTVACLYTGLHCDLPRKPCSSFSSDQQVVHLYAGGLFLALFVVI